MSLYKLSKKQLYKKCGRYLAKSIDYEKKFEAILEELESRR